jgi:hypothetical protein
MNSQTIMPGSKTSHFKYSIADGVISILVKATSETLTFSATELPTAMQNELRDYGLKQLLSDRSAALPETSEKVVQMRSTYADLMEGIWTGGRGGDATGLSKAHVEFAEAAAKAFGKDAEVIKAALLAMEPDSSNAAGNTVAGERTLYVREKSKNPKIAAILADVAAAKAKEKAKAAAKAAKESGDGGDDLGIAF